MNNQEGYNLSVGTRFEQAQSTSVGSTRKKGVTSAHVVGKKLTTLMHEDPNSFWEAAQHEFGVALQSMSLDLMDSLDVRLNILGQKVSLLETTARAAVAARDARALAREAEAVFIAEQERSEKSLLSQWLQGFAQQLHKQSSASALQHALEIGLGLDAVDFAFCRYALNVALAAPSVSQEKMIISRVPQVLVGIIDGANAAMVHATSREPCKAVFILESGNCHLGSCTCQRRWSIARKMFRRLSRCHLY